MRKFCMLCTSAVLITAALAGTAAAEGLRGRLAATGRLGITNPAESEKNSDAGRLVVPTDAGIIGGGGFMFGVDETIAVELNLTRSTYHTSGFGRADVTNLSVGAQYRFPERQRLVPYGGGGVDVLINDLSQGYANTTIGAHLSGGVDYVVNRQVALNAELKGVESFSADVEAGNGTKLGKFDPSSLSLTFGVRFFFN